MYSLKRKQRINEQLALVNEQGKQVKVLTVDLDVDTVLGRYNQAKNTIIRAEQIIKDNQSEKNLEEYGQAVCELLEVILGESNTKEILDFYDNRYVEMLDEVYPYILEVIEPKLRQISREKAKQMQARIRK